MRDNSHKLIYLSSPYSSVKDKEMLMRQIMTISGKYMMENPGQHIVSPLFNHYSLSLVPDMGTDYVFWRDYSKNLLHRCDEMMVLKFPGWETSSGVSDEVSLAQGWLIPLSFVEPETFL